MNSYENLGSHHYRQREVQYEFCPEFKEYSAQKVDCQRHRRTLSKQKLLSDAEADILAQEQVKDKLLYRYIENGRQIKYNAPESSQDDVNLMFTKIQ